MANAHIVIFATFVCVSAWRITVWLLVLTSKEVVFMWCHTSDDGGQKTLEVLFDFVPKKVAADAHKLCERLCEHSFSIC